MGLVVSLALALAIFIVSTQAQAADAGPLPGQGTLMLKSESGEAAVAAPLLFTDVDIAVSGMTARATVTQRFVNPTSQWEEGIYVFPLPEKAAVDHLEMRIGQRRIEGQIRERTRAAYEQAKTEGRKVTLVEQERPNVFTTNVAHVGPGEEITVTIEYQETLRYDTGAFRLRFPIRGAALRRAHSPSTARRAQAGERTRIRCRTASASPHRGEPRGRFHQSGDAQHRAPSWPRVEDRCPTPDRRQRIGGSPYTVSLANGPVPANRDFSSWDARRRLSRRGALRRAQKRQDVCARADRTAGTAAGDAPRSPREAVFIIDTSGSMEGTSIKQAKQALQMALDRLQPGDRFNVIEFNSVTRALFGAPMPVDTSTLARARTFVAALRARGGTEMKPALEAALTHDAAPGFVRQVVFLTDGAVGNEGELIHLIRERLSDRRLFTIGIGSAPNSYFLKAAQWARHIYVHWRRVREVAERWARSSPSSKAPY